MNKFMRMAYKEAEKAKKFGEIPVGAVIVHNGKVLAKAHNKKETNRCAVAHAEILAIQKASKKLNNWRLSGAELYVTLEPCIMCMGAIYAARIGKVFYGASDNSCDIKININNTISNHKLDCFTQVDAKECEVLLKTFFAEKRNIRN